MNSKGHPESPEITGLLYKKRGGFGKMMPNCWQYRLFILSKDGVLTYYDTEVPENKDIFESKERGRLDLRGVKVELTTDSTEGAPTPHTIVIQPEEGEKWKLCADTREDHARWWKMIEKFISENPEKGRLSNMNIQSDDDGDTYFTRTPAGSRNSKRGSVPARGIEVDQNTTKSPLASAQSTSSVAFDFSTTPKAGSPNAPTTTGTSGKKKGGLKLTKKDGSFLSQEWIEWTLVLVIVNICICGLLASTRAVDLAIFVVALNGVVGHTLYLRAARANANATATATATATSVPAPTASSESAAVTGGVSSANAAAAKAGGGNPSLAAPVTSTSAVSPSVPAAASSGSIAATSGIKKPISGMHCPPSLFVNVLLPF